MVGAAGGKQGDRAETSKTFTLDSHAVKKNPPETSMDVYNALGEVTLEMNVLYVDEKVINAVLPCFKHLEALELQVHKLKDLKAIETFPAVKTLILKTGITDKPYLNALLKRSAATLLKLVCEKAPHADFELLTKLERLEMDGIRLGDKSQFWRTNTTLKELTITFVDDPYDPDPIFYNWDVVRDNLRDISEMEDLKAIKWIGVGKKNFIPRIIPLFDHVVDFNVYFEDSALLLPMISNVGPHLEKMKVFYHEETASLSKETQSIFVKMVELIGQRFPALRFLELCALYSGVEFDKHPFTKRETKPLYALANLQRLNINLDTPEATYALFRNIPTLKEVCNVPCDPPAKAISREFEEFLKKEKRRVKIFGGELIEVNQDYTTLLIPVSCLLVTAPWANCNPGDNQ